MSWQLPGATGKRFSNPGSGHMVTDRALRLLLLAAGVFVLTIGVPRVIWMFIDPSWIKEVEAIRMARYIITLVVMGLVFMAVPFFAMHMICAMFGGKNSETTAWVFVGLSILLFLWMVLDRVWKYLALP